ncbi:MAG: hypothetical protein JWN76_3113 [Chitinophagaceae bacterium]|nr:hypothetical protein [Chitinophagaceae bacterium]
MNVQTRQPLVEDGQGILDIVALNSGNLILKILDVQGRIAKTIIEKVEQGAQQLMVNMNDLGEGMYVLNVFNGDSFIKAIRFTKD